MSGDGGEGQREREFGKGLGRAFGGALLFSVPLLMTMEMWFLGLYLSRLRLALFTVATLGLLVGLVHTIGFKKGSQVSWRDAAVDAGVAYLVGFTTAAGVLWLLSVLGAEHGWTEGLAIVALEASPAAIGAAFARSSMGGGSDIDQTRERYGGELFLMAAGAVVFAYNLAPTEEMILIGYRMTEFESVALAVLSLALLHALVYTLGFAGSSGGRSGLADFFRFTVAGYLLVLLASAYLLWTFGRFETVSPVAMLGPILVLAFPGVLGAGAARLIL